MDHASGPLIVDHPIDSVRVLKLNRPERLNAVSAELYAALFSALEDADSARDVRAVVITGTGRAFCVGADLKAHGSTSPDRESRRNYVQLAQKTNRLLQTLTKPVVAAVNGHAIGAGLELALSCDLIVVAKDAKCRLPEVGLGTFVGGGVTYTLAQRVGVAKAKEIIMLGEFFTGADAAEMGIANRVVEAESVLGDSLAMAELLAAKAPVPMRLAKELLLQSLHCPAEEALDREAEALLRCMETSDWREGIDAFHDKRSPKFVGD